MKDYNNIVIIYPKDETIEFLEPIVKILESFVPEANLLRPEVGYSYSAITDETDLVIFLGHGTPSNLYGGTDEKGEKSIFLNTTQGSMLLDNITIVLFSCNSFDYLKKLQNNATIEFYVVFGDMPTDWEHIYHNRKMNSGYLIDFDEEHLEYYKLVLVDALVEGFKYCFHFSSLIGIPKGISLIVHRRINEILLEKKWSKPQKLQMIDLLVTFKGEVRYAQPL